MALLKKTITVTDAEGKTHQVSIREWRVDEQTRIEDSKPQVIEYVRLNLDAAGQAVLPTLGLREAQRIHDAIIKLNWGPDETVAGN